MTIERSFVPKLYFLVVGDHVRPDAGLFNILGAGIDRVGTEVPGLVNLGIAGRIIFTNEEAEDSHAADIRITGPGGTPLVQIHGQMAPAAGAGGLPDDWPHQGGLAINMAVPIQQHGVHTLTLLIDGEE